MPCHWRRPKGRALRSGCWACRRLGHFGARPVGGPRVPFCPGLRALQSLAAMPSATGRLHPLGDLAGPRANRPILRADLESLAWHGIRARVPWAQRRVGFGRSQPPRVPRVPLLQGRLLQSPTPPPASLGGGREQPIGECPARRPLREHTGGSAVRGAVREAGYYTKGILRTLRTLAFSSRRVPCTQSLSPLRSRRALQGFGSSSAGLGRGRQARPVNTAVAAHCRACQRPERSQLAGLARAVFGTQQLGL